MEQHKVNNLRPVERRILRLLSDGMTHSEISVKFRKTPRFVWQVQKLAEYKLMHYASE